MTKPSLLLRRAQEFASQRAVFQLSEKEILVSPLMAAFAEKIVRECAEIVMQQPREIHGQGVHKSLEWRIHQAILDKFELEEE